MALSTIGRNQLNTGIDDNSDATAMTINSSENIGIGTSTITNTSNYRNIHVEGTTGTIMRFMANGTQVGQIQSDTNEFQLNAITNDPMVFKTNNTEAMRISSSNVGIGTNSPSVRLDTRLGTTTGKVAEFHNSVGYGIGFTVESDGGVNTINSETNQDLAFATNGASNERMRIEANNVLFGKTVSASSTNGVSIGIGTNEGFVSATNSSDPVLYLNRQSSDGTLAQFRHADTTEGTISISGTTVSYNGGHLSRWSQATDGNRIDGLVKGTVMTNLDQMAEWTKDGVTEDNEQLNCMAVSSVEGDANVAGVFVNWDDDDTDYTADMNIAMTGDMVIRIAQGTTVARGDLLMSAGDGTAKPQGDDIVRSKTIAKVTSTTVSHTYDDGTFLVPCVLMAC